MKKRHFVLFLVLILSTFLVTAILVDKNTNKWESADSIFIKLETSQTSLQQAITDSLLKNSPKTTSSTIISSLGHGFENIWVSVNSIEMTFKNAVQNTNLCGTSTPKTTYSNELDPGHLGTEIEVNIEGVKSLQDSINDGTLAKINGGWDKDFENDPNSWWSTWTHSNSYNDGSGGTCSASCGGGTQIRTRTKTCTNPDPFCGGANCTGSDTEIQEQSCNAQTCCPSGTTEVNGDCYGSWQPNNWCSLGSISVLCNKDNCLHGSPASGGWSGSSNDFNIFTCLSTDITSSPGNPYPDGYCIDAAQIQSGVSCSGPNNGYCYREVYCK